MYLNGLAKRILSILPDGISKVRFAKTIYLTHKGLVQANLSESHDLSFIRMPLGPVPKDFKSLDSDSDISRSTSLDGLIYNKQTYRLRPYVIAFGDNDFQRTVQSIVENLDRYSTSFLVEYTHKEPSWINHSNSEIYTLTTEDLAKALPDGKPADHEGQQIEDQKIQALLLNGMLDDIVDESTALEYPEKTS